MHFFRAFESGDITIPFIPAGFEYRAVTFASAKEIAADEKVVGRCLFHKARHVLPGVAGIFPGAVLLFFELGIGEDQKALDLGLLTIGRKQYREKEE